MLLFTIEEQFGLAEQGISITGVNMADYVIPALFGGPKAIIPIAKPYPHPKQKRLLYGHLFVALKMFNILPLQESMGLNDVSLIFHEGKKHPKAFLNGTRDRFHFYGEVTNSLTVQICIFSTEKT